MGVPEKVARPFTNNISLAIAARSFRQVRSSVLMQGPRLGGSNADHPPLAAAGAEDRSSG
jgi:hypothetical protein